MEPPPQDPDPGQPGPADRLDSWKEIAAYLRRSPRTVQRWERQEGLPVHRLVHDKLGSVYAYRAELDAWWAERRSGLEGDTDEGVSDTESRSTAQTEVASPSHLALRSAIVAIAAAVLVTAAGAAFVLWRGRSEPVTSSPGTQRVRLAVLPFTNLTGDQSREYLSDGLTEELIAGLGRVRDLGVIARTSVMKYKGTGQTVREIGRDLRVNYVLEGSVRADDKRVRVTAQLIRVSDETHVWSDSFDHDLEGLLRIEGEVASRVAEQVRLRIPVATSPDVNPNAHLAYLQGRYFWNKRTQPDFERAIAFFEQALAIDRNYAPAYSGLADSYVLLSNYGHWPVDKALPKAKEAANRALVLDDGLAEGHASLGFVVEVYDRDFHVAAQQFERALALNPNYATGRLWYGLMLLDLGRFEEARAQFMTGLEGDPLSSALRANLATCDFFAGKYEEAIAGLRREVELAPDSPFPYLDLGRVYIQKGDYPNGLETLRRAQKMAAVDPMFDAVLGYGLARAGRRAEAEEIYSRLLRESSERRVAPYYLAVMSAGLDRRDEAFRWLEEVLRERHVGGLSFAVEPEFASLRGDPRFQDLRRRAGLN